MNHSLPKLPHPTGPVSTVPLSLFSNTCVPESPRLWLSSWSQSESPNPFPTNYDINRVDSGGTVDKEKRETSGPSVFDSGSEGPRVHRLRNRYVGPRTLPWSPFYPPGVCTTLTHTRVCLVRRSRVGKSRWREMERLEPVPEFLGTLHP